MYPGLPIRLHPATPGRSRPLSGLRLAGLGDPINDAAQAIAQAEGFGVPGAAPTRYHNPGDLSKGDEWGQNVSGYITLPDGENLIIFSSDQDGWNALYAKLQNILNGGSRVYSPSMTWIQIAQQWAGNWQTWLNNVTLALGVSPADTFSNYFSGLQPPSAVADVSPQIILPDGQVISQPGIGAQSMPAAPDLPASTATQGTSPAFLIAAVAAIALVTWVTR